MHVKAEFLPASKEGYWPINNKVSGNHFDWSGFPHSKIQCCSISMQDSELLSSQQFSVTQTILALEEKSLTTKLSSEEEFILQQARALENVSVTHERSCALVELSKAIGFYIPSSELPPDFIGSLPNEPEERIVNSPPNTFWTV